MLAALPMNRGGTDALIRQRGLDLVAIFHPNCILMIDMLGPRRFERSYDAAHGFQRIAI